MEISNPNEDMESASTAQEIQRFAVLLVYYSQ